MKQLLIGVGLFSLSAIALAGEKVDRTMDAASDGYVSIEHVNGYAKVSGWDKDEVRVVGELGDRTDEFIFERDGKEIVIRVKVKNHRGWSNWSDEDGDNLEIFVPEGSRINYSSTNANLDVSDIFGGSDIDTVNGDVEAQNLKGRIRVEAVNGDIETKALEGRVTIETVNGDIKERSEEVDGSVYTSVNGDIDVHTTSKDLVAETVNGDIELALQQVEELNLSTVNGSIEAKMTLTKDSDVRASSVGGSITLSFPDDVSARFDIEAHAGGRITNELSNDKMKKAKYGPSRWLEFSVNGGDAKVDVSTVSGRVRLEKN